MTLVRLILLWGTVTQLSQAFMPLGTQLKPHLNKHKRSGMVVAMADPLHVAIVETAISTTQAHLHFLPLDSLDTTGIIVSDSSDTTPTSYSKWSYYTTLSLYALSFPGIWSQIKRSTSAKLKRKTYVSAGESVEGGKNLRQQAGEIMAYMKANNYQVVEAGEVITFRGLVQKSNSQAFFLVFITALALASLALVLQIQFQDICTCHGIYILSFVLIILSV